MSDTPYTDLHEAHWEDFAGSNLLVVEADRCRKLERDRAELLAALKKAADTLIWANTHALEKTGRKFERIVSDMENEKWVL